MKVKASQAMSMITSYIRANLVPLLTGSPGCGKSQIVYQIAAEHNLKVIDLRLAQCDPTDLGGFPHTWVDDNGIKRAGYIPMETFPIKGDPLPEGYDGWLLFLDELTSASTAVQAASYKVILDRAVGIHKLHKNVAIVAAGNLETDNAIVNSMSTALQSRLVHMELVIDYKEWLDWASSNDIDHRITSYINFKPGNLYTFDPNHTDDTYAAPRTWEFSSRLIKQETLKSGNILPLLAGTISEGVAREFLGFCSIFDRLPSFQTIIDTPLVIPVPDEPSILFALTGSISHNVDKTNLSAAMEFVKRIPVEFQVVCLREIVRRKKELIAEPAINQWITDSAANLFD